MPKHLTKEKKRNTKYNTYLKGKMFAILSRSFAHFVLHLRISIHTHNKCAIYNANSVQCDIISKMQNAYISIVSNASIFLWFLYGCIYLYVDVHQLMLCIFCVSFSHSHFAAQFFAQGKTPSIHHIPTTNVANIENSAGFFNYETFFFSRHISIVKNSTIL